MGFRFFLVFLQKSFVLRTYTFVLYYTKAINKFYFAFLGIFFKHFLVSIFTFTLLFCSFVLIINILFYQIFYTSKYLLIIDYRISKLFIDSFRKYYLQCLI